MVLHIKKERLAGFATVLLLVCAVLVYILPMPEETQTAAAPLARTVVLDAGHGGEDGGATGVDGTLEKDLNLAVASRVAEKLAAAGFEVIMTRTEDVSLSTGGNTVKARKISDLKERVRMMDEHADAVFVSIHMNKYPDGNVSGGQVFYASGSAVGEKLASCIQTSLRTLQTDNNRVHKEADKGIYILRHTITSGAIVECGFVSNKAELAQLKSDEYQDKLAECIAAGVQQFYQTNGTGTAA